MRTEDLSPPTKTAFTTSLQKTMKKSFPRIFWILIVGIIVLGVLRFTSPEDTRICDNGQRIMHGNPDAAMPTEACTTSGEIDLTNCISYFDGCNNCTVKDGKPDACTLMYCETPAEPKCNEYASGTTNNGSVGLANPASTNCINNGGTLEIVTGPDGGQIGMCTLKDGTVCEERAYMRGECGSTNNEQWTTNNNWKACTEEAKLCDDGSAVGRTWPNCEFAPCPSEWTACTMQYDPVCASVAVQCIKAPCPAIEQTFGNECMMNANKLAKFLYKGECKK